MEEYIQQSIIVLEQHIMDALNRQVLKHKRQGILLVHKGFSTTTPWLEFIKNVHAKRFVCSQATPSTLLAVM